MLLLHVAGLRPDLAVLVATTFLLPPRFPVMCRRLRQVNVTLRSAQKETRRQASASPSAAAV